MDRVLATDPDLIDGRMYLASYWHDQGKPKKALDAALKGLALGNRHIPEGFAGQIEWAHPANRTYLRLLNTRLRGVAMWQPCARAAFAADSDDFPPYYYELALSLVLTGAWIAAATALRRGFAGNPYIADIQSDRCQAQGRSRPRRLALVAGIGVAMSWRHMSR